MQLLQKMILLVFLYWFVNLITSVYYYFVQFALFDLITFGPMFSTALLSKYLTLRRAGLSTFVCVWTHLTIIMCQSRRKRSWHLVPESIRVARWECYWKPNLGNTHWGRANLGNTLGKSEVRECTLGKIKRHVFPGSAFTLGSHPNRRYSYPLPIPIQSHL